MAEPLHRIDLAELDEALEGQWVDIRATRRAIDQIRIEGAAFGDVGYRESPNGVEVEDQAPEDGVYARVQITIWRQAIVAWSLTESGQRPISPFPMSELSSAAFTPEIMDFVSTKIIEVQGPLRVRGQASPKVAATTSESD